MESASAVPACLFHFWTTPGRSARLPAPRRSHPILLPPIEGQHSKCPQHANGPVRLFHAKCGKGQDPRCKVPHVARLAPETTGVTAIVFVYMRRQSLSQRGELGGETMQRRFLTEHRDQFLWLHGGDTPRIEMTQSLSQLQGGCKGDPGRMLAIQQHTEE